MILTILRRNHPAEVKVGIKILMKCTLIIFLVLSSCLFGQNGKIIGLVLDSESQPIMGANVIVKNTLLGTSTDAKGKFTISKIPSGNYSIIVSAIGYEKNISDTIKIDNNLIELSFQLIRTTYNFNQLVVTANKFSQEINEVAASTVVIDQEVFSKRNFQKVDDALRYVPGIVMTSDQISIRGSSGYSRGAGTRVLVAIDGIPIYAPESGDIIWELVPITEIGSIEIIKGSASSLYGSSAIGGVVNIISKEISSNPVTFIKFQGGLYATPSHNQWKWTDRTLSFNSQTISHTRAFGNLRLAVSLTRFEDYSYRQNDFQLRYAGFLKAKYQFSKSTTLSLLATGYTRDKETFNYWRNIENALSPPQSDIGSSTNSDRTILGLTFDHIFSNNFSLSVIPSTYISYWKDDSESRNRSDSKIYRTELRTNYKYSDLLSFISGAELQYTTVNSNIFGVRDAKGLGLYTQTDYKPFDKLNFSMGLRYDMINLADLESNQSLSPKLGINYRLDIKTFIRGRISKGFRAPTLAEGFTSTTTNGLTIKPNPNIKSETSYSFEIGINHIFNDKVSIDFSLFNNEYSDMIEPGIDPTDSQAFFNNVTRARIQGIETSSTINIFPNLEANIGYTFLWARNTEDNTALNYRPKHTVITGIEFDNNIFQLGANFRYLSKVENIDYELVELGLVVDGDNRVDIYVLDIHAGTNLFRYKIPAKIFFNVNNLLNYNYVELIGNIAPLRNYSLNLEFVF